MQSPEKEKDHCMDVCMERVHAGHCLFPEKYIDEVFKLDISSELLEKIKQTKKNR